MPFYDYECDECGEVFEAYLQVLARDSFPGCDCGGVGYRLLSAPAVQEWKKDRSFPNLRKDGDGSMKFDSKSDYNKYLKENHIYEISTDARKYNKSCTTVVSRDRTQTNRVSPRNRVEV
jgi:putative FmdB family regulatory protein